MIKNLSTFLAGTFLFVFTTAHVAADAVSDISKKVADAAFSEAERQVIEKYYEISGRTRQKAGQSDEDEHGDAGIDNDRLAAAKDTDRKKGKNKSKHRGKGKNKQKTLPRGIAKKLERGGTMPPGIAKTRLPAELESQLPAPPSGFERLESEGKVVLAEIATGIIADIIRLGTGASSSDEKSMNRTETVPQAPESHENPATPQTPAKKWWQIWKD